MPNTRDNFTSDTIRRTASRVGYRCSFPDCPCATVGASMENEEKVSTTGVAAHICAAAPGGPRYDESMSSDERKSINNCIWLCQNHAKLIDTDEKTYTVEILKKWKKDAETKAAISLADTNFFNTYHLSNGDDLRNLEDIFEGFVVEGNYEHLKNIVSLYNNDLGDYYNEIVYRYKIIYDCYCQRSCLDTDVSAYVTLPIKLGINKIIEIFISFSLDNQLKILLPFCEDDDLVSTGNSLLNGELFTNLTISTQKSKQFECPKHLLNMIQKFIANTVFKNDYLGAKDEKGNLLKIYDGEKFYKLQRAAFEIATSASRSEKPKEENFIILKDDFDKILLFDEELQIKLIAYILRGYTNDEEKFLQIYSNCTEEIKSNNDIKEIYYCFQIITKSNEINIDDLIDFCKLKQDYYSLDLYLSSIPPQERIVFLDNNKFLFAKDSCFLYHKYILSSDSEKENFLDTLEPYSKYYENDFNFSCIKMIVTPISTECEDVWNWLASHTHQVTPQSLMLYINALEKHKKFKELYEISQYAINRFAIYRIAQVLQTSGNPEFMSYSKVIYGNLVKENYQIEGLYFNLFLMQKAHGEYENAKESIKSEYDLYKRDEVLIEFLNLRYTTNEFKDDEYLGYAKRSLNPVLQNLVGATMERLNNYVEAFKYCLRSLLIDKDNVQCLRGLYLICSNIPEPPSKISNENSVCLLKNDSGVLRIAIYNSDLIENIVPNDFADCKHFSSDNPIISKLLFSKCGDNIDFEGFTYTLTEVIPLTVFISRKSFESIVEDPNTIKFQGASAEDAIKEMTKYMEQSSKKSKELIEEYNNAQIRYPLSIFSQINGKSMLRTVEFLAYGNSEKIRNNPNSLAIHGEDVTIVLSYDSIVLLCLLDLLDLISSKYKLICPPAVEEKMLNDIRDEISDLTAENTKGSLSFSNGHLTLFEHNQDSRSTRYKYLMQLKSFLSTVPKGKRLDFIPSIEGLTEVFKNERLLCEQGCLALVQNTEKTVLLTDDQFLFALAQLEKIQSIGLLSLLCENTEDISEIITNSQNLQKIKFAKYFSAKVYDKVETLIKTEDDILAFGNWLASDNQDEEPSDYHRNLIVEVYREYMNTKKEQQIYQDVFCDIIINHFLHLHPEVLDDIFKQ